MAGGGVDEAVEALAALLGLDPAVAPDRFRAALKQAPIRDDQDRAPVDPDWTPTWDITLAAAAYAEGRAIAATTGDEGGLTEFSSEGSSYKRSSGTGAAEWWALARQFRRRSNASAFHVIEIEAEPAFIPRSRRSSWRA